VPDSTEAIFKPGSDKSAALLYDATDAFESKNVKADEYIRNIKGREEELKNAIDQCVRIIAFSYLAIQQPLHIDSCSAISYSWMLLLMNLMPRPNVHY
jgi:hypothetical protein